MSEALRSTVAGLDFANPVLLASGTAGYGRELSGVIDLERVGGFVTKAVSPEPRHGNAPPRVWDFDGGMINAVGLANPGLAAVRAEALPWIATHVRRARVFVNVVGHSIEDYAEVVAGLDASPGFHGFELNVSCPNTKKGGLEFGADPESLRTLVTRARAATAKPLFVKLSPTLPDVVGTARIAIESGATGVTLFNTMPGLVVDTETRRPVLGFGSGGVSGPALLPVAALAVRRVTQALPGVPVIGTGGVSTADHVLQLMLAGASLVALGTASMADPRAVERIVRDLTRWCEARNVPRLADLRGSLEWPT
ncbi:MAG: dihydroorotate dehydrogenase [Gemmatimonadaceae bacterium]|nr:dihydroorotate dehydrogenase [Gemmatimonadaceae bacterium]